MLQDGEGGLEDGNTGVLALIGGLGALWRINFMCTAHVYNNLKNTHLAFFFISMFIVQLVKSG